MLKLDAALSGGVEKVLEEMVWCVRCEAHLGPSAAVV